MTSTYDGFSLPLETMVKVEDVGRNTEVNIMPVGVWTGLCYENIEMTSLSWLLQCLSE